MKNNGKLITATAILAMVAMTTPAFAWMGDWSGSRMNRGSRPPASAQAFTAEQQKKVDEIQGKYQPQLQELRDNLNAKQDELIAARSDNTTTVGRLNVLEGELFQLERQYWTLMNQANAEATRVVGTGFAPYFTCGYTGCNHQGHTGAMMPDRHMACC